MTIVSPQPELTVVVPILDLRSLGLRGLEAWTRGQDAVPRSYEVIAVVPKTSRHESGVRALLREGDRLVRGGEPNLTSLLHEGALEASSPNLLLTEGHCLPQPGCAQAVSRRFQTGAAAVLVRAEHINTSRAARAEQEIYESHIQEWVRGGATHAVRLRGFGLQRALYFRAGGLDSSLDFFAERAFGWALADLGVQVEYVDDSAIAHLNSDSLRYVREGVASYAKGEARFIQRVGYSAFENRFGPFTELWESQASRRAVAWEEVRALTQLLSRPMSSSETKVVRRALAGRLLRLPLGEASVRAGALFAVWHSLIRFGTLPPSAGIRAPYEEAWRSFARAERLKWLVDSAPRESSALEVDDLIAPNALGFFAPETVDGRLHRWSRCAASLFIGSPLPFRFVRLAGGPGGGAVDRALAVRVDGRPARFEALGDDIRISHPEERFSPGLHRVTFAVQPRLRAAPFPTAMGLGLLRVKVEA